MNIERRLIGKRIKNSRMLCNLTQEQLAEKVDVVPNHIAKIESGMRMPSIELLKKLANVLHVTVDDLLCGSKEEYIDPENPIQSPFSDCNIYEKSMMIDMLFYLKRSLRDNQKLIEPSYYSEMAIAMRNHLE